MSTITVKETAAAVRKALRAEYPDARFSVRMATGTAHGWLDVSWTDGPRDGAVRDFVARFESSRFDGMTDSYTNTGNSAWNCCGINTHRSYSDEFIARTDAMIQHDETGLPFAFLPEPVEGRTSVASDEPGEFGDRMLGYRLRALVSA